MRRIQHRLPRSTHPTGYEAEKKGLRFQRGGQFYARLHFDVIVKVKNRVIPAPHHVRGRLQQESSRFKPIWIPAFAGMTL